MAAKKIDKIRAVTDAGLRFDVVGKECLARLKAQKPTDVFQEELRSSRDVLLSEGFYNCQGIALYDCESGVGALAHNYSSSYPSSDPCIFLTGKRKDAGVEDPHGIFHNMDRTVAIHVYHVGWHVWSDLRVEEALRSIGIVKINHVPIKPKARKMSYEKIADRDIALDSRNGMLYIFPRDFGYGISLKV